LQLADRLAGRQFSIDKVGRNFRKQLTAEAVFARAYPSTQLSGAEQSYSGTVFPNQRLLFWIVLSSVNFERHCGSDVGSSSYFESACGSDAGSSGHVERHCGSGGTSSQCERPCGFKAGSNSHFKHPCVCKAGVSSHFKRHGGSERSHAAM
jgi:hypothetical protein